MKKVSIVVVVLILIALSLSGCKSQDCPAYSQVETESPVRV